MAPGATLFRPGLGEDFYPEDAFSEDTVLVVRTAALDDLKLRISQLSQPDVGERSSMDKPLGTKERTTLLIVIAALASEAKVDVNAPSKAASIIEAAASGLGLKIGKRTIEEWLKRIPHALERRR